MGPMPEGLCLSESSLHLELKSEASEPDELARKLVPGKKILQQGNSLPFKVKNTHERCSTQN